MAVASSKRKHSKFGGVFIEVALAMPIFLVALIVGMDVVRAAFSLIKFEQGVADSGRFAALGLKYSGDATGVNSIRRFLAKNTGSLRRDITIDICKFGDVSNLNHCHHNTRGGLSDWMFLKATTHIKLLFGAVSLPISSSTVIRNEPRPSSQLPLPRDRVR